MTACREAHASTKEAAAVAARYCRHPVPPFCCCQSQCPQVPVCGATTQLHLSNASSAAALSQQQVGAGPHAAPQAQHCVHMAPQQEHHSLTWQRNAARCGQTKHLQMNPAQVAAVARPHTHTQVSAGAHAAGRVARATRHTRHWTGQAFAECINVMLLWKGAVVSKIVETHTQTHTHTL